MADLITLAHAIPLKGTAGSSHYQVVSEAVDVSAYDSVEFQIGATSDHPNGITVYILTSMQNRVDDIANSSPSWYSLGNVALTSANAGTPIYKSLSVPTSSTNSPMLRWIRYQIDLGASTTYTSFSIEGLARRGLRIG